MAFAQCGPPQTFIAPALEAVETQAAASTEANEQKNFMQRMKEWFQKGKEESQQKQQITKDDLEAMKLEAERKFERRLAFARTMKTVTQFYPVIILILIILAFFGKPLEYIIMIITAIIVTILFAIVFCLFSPVINIIPYIPWNFAVYVIPYVVYSLIILVVFIFITVFISLLALINVATGNSLKDWIICENSPEDWYKMPSFQLGNRYSRGFFCGKPCASRYVPDGDNCKKMYRYQPSYCPHAQVMRMYTGFKRGDSVPYFMEYNQMDFRYLMKQPHKREQILKDHFLKRRKFLSLCAGPMFPYRNITRNMCASVDALEKNNSIKVTEALTLKQICRQAFCTSETNYPFCSIKAVANSTDGSQLVKQIVKVICIIIIFFLILSLALSLLLLKRDT